jgi:hypothetical protein
MASKLALAPAVLPPTNWYTDSAVSKSVTFGRHAGTLGLGRRDAATEEVGVLQVQGPCPPGLVQGESVDHVAGGDGIRGAFQIDVTTLVCYQRSAAAQRLDEPVQSPLV